LSIPRLLKAANPQYRTAHFGKWDMRYDEVTPEEMGYDVSDGYTNNSTGGGKQKSYPAAVEDPKEIWAITHRGIEFMTEQVKTGNPFYLQLSHYAVHLGIFYRAPTLRQTQGWPRGRKHSTPEFAAMTADMDTGIGLLLDSLESLGLNQTTYIFFLSDNGGRNTIPGQADRTEPRNAPLRDGKHSFYEGGIRVPFIVAGPGIKQGSVSNVAVTGLDILPTLADLANFQDPLPGALDGGSLKAVLTREGHGKVVRQSPFLFFHQAVDRVALTALILDNYKLVRTWARNREELFDLSVDIGESTDLSAKMPDKAAQLRTLMDDFLLETNASTQGGRKNNK
jgi:arylsulfatase A